MDFERLMNRHKDAVYRQMVRVCGNKEDAEDALAEALFGAYKALDNLRSEDAFRVWLGTIGRRVCLRMKSSERFAPILNLVDVDQPTTVTPETELASKQMKVCVQEAVMTLPTIYRDTYILREIEERPAEEVARILSQSIPSVKSRLHRARKMVRDHLDQSLCIGPEV